MSDVNQEKAKALVKEQATIVFNEYREKLDARFEDVVNKDSIAKMDARLDEIQTQLDAANAMLKGGEFTTGSDKGDRAEADYAAAFTKSLSGAKMTDSDEAVISNYHKSWNVSVSTAAGYLIPKAMASEIIRQVEAKVPFFGLSENRGTASLESAFLVQTGKGTAGLATEVATSANTAEGAINEVRIKAYDIDAEPSVTRTLIEDAGFDVVEFITWNAADVIGDTFGNLIVNGSGSAQPKGLLASANTTSTFEIIKEVTSGANNSFTFDDLIDLKYDLNARYATNTTAFVMSREAVKIARKFKDTQGQYLWQPALVAGQPALIDGDAVYVSPYIDAVADGTRPVFYGDWKTGSAIVRHTGGDTILTDPYTNKRLIKVYTKQRLGFGTVDARALRVLKIQ